MLVPLVGYLSTERVRFFVTPSCHQIPPLDFCYCSVLINFQPHPFISSSRGRSLRASVDNCDSSNGLYRHPAPEPHDARIPDHVRGKPDNGEDYVTVGILPKQRNEHLSCELPTRWTRLPFQKRVVYPPVRWRACSVIQPVQYTLGPRTMTLEGSPEALHRTASEINEGACWGAAPSECERVILGVGDVFDEHPNHKKGDLVQTVGDNHNEGEVVGSNPGERYGDNPRQRYD